MPNLKEVKNRISSVVSTQQITKAMKMVAAAKLRKAQDMIVKLRPYAEKLTALQHNVAASLADESISSPYLIEREAENVALVVIASDRGLCGAFNSATFKKAMSLINSELKPYRNNGKLTIIPIGKKSLDFFKRGSFHVIDKHNALLTDLSFNAANDVSQSLMNSFVAKEFDRVILVYNEFINAATQVLKSEQFLPISLDIFGEKENEKYGTDYIFEPSREELLLEIIPHSLKIMFYRAVLESNASEQGARMVAMDQATENAGELLKQLRLTYNRTRQATITREILEIVGGAEALASGK